MVDVVPDKVQWPTVGQKIISTTGNVYTVGKQLGNGYFSIVYEGTDLWDNRLAIKVIKPGKNEVRDYERERGNLISFRHPNITHIYDCFELNGMHCLVTERCDHTLREYLAMPGAVSDKWLLPLARAILQAVAFLHRANWVHQDIHPGNVFVSFLRNDYDINQSTSVWRFKLGDLGLSRCAQDLKIDSTMAEWMRPPEAMDPLFGKLDHRMDIYHVALLLLFACMGRELRFTREQALDGAPKKVAEGLHSPVGNVIAWGLRRHVINRPQTAIGFWQALKQSLVGSLEAKESLKTISY